MSISIVLFYIGRIIFGGYFIMNGINHIKGLEGMAGYAASKGVPVPKLAVLVSGLLLLIGGLGILFNYAIVYALIALIVFLIPVTFQMHQFWKETDPMQKMGQQINFMKNMALLGAVIIMLSIVI